jgi:hypothetical protein
MSPLRPDPNGTPSVLSNRLKRRPPETCGGRLKAARTTSGRDAPRRSEPQRNQSQLRSAYNRLITKLKNRKLVAPDFSKTLTDIRSTGADALQKSRQHKGYYELYLGHATRSVGETHYVTHGKVDPNFDTAITWLGKKLGLLEIDRKQGAK